MNHLFIGGDRDGERNPVSESLHEVRIPKPRPAAFMGNPDDVAFAVSIEHETYHRATLGYEYERWTVFILNSIPEREIIPRLIDGYRKSE